jgi:hypothetical protein
MSIIIGIGGLLIAALVLLLNYRERVAAHRIALYTRQLDAYQEIATAAATVAGRTDLLVKLGAERDAEGTLRAAVIGAALDLAGIRVRHSMFIADPVFKSLSDFEQSVEAIAYPKIDKDEGDEGSPFARVYTKDPMLPVTVAQMTLVAEMRKQIGTDKLSEETLRLVREPPVEP